MCFGNRLGFSFSAEALDKKLLFAPNAGAMIAEMDAVSTIPGSVSLGVVTETPEIVIDGQALPLDRLLQAWAGRSKRCSPSDAPEVPVSHAVPLWKERNRRAPVFKTPPSRRSLSRYSRYQLRI